jgi:5-methylcytosine-specific restriction endonuclease McrA
VKAERRTDRRYRSAAWRRLRLRVLARDMHVCRVVPGCTNRATVADHIEPVRPDTPDALFFAERNLRAACRDHNLARALAPELDGRVDAGPSAVITRDYTA